MTQPAIRVENLTKTFRTGRGIEVHALQGLTLEIGQGEIFALLGSNGAGKSTFMKILLGTMIPSGGSASILGIPVTDMRSRKHVGYQPEQSFLPPNLTLTSVLDLSARLSRIPPRIAGPRALDLMKQFHLVESRSIPLKNYSKGMLRLAGIAQAFMNDPKVLFLDEPTDGLDPEARRSLSDFLKRARDIGKTIFLNSHVLSEVETIADRVAIIKRGILLKVASVRELTSANSRYVITTRDPIPSSILSDVRGADNGLPVTSVHKIVLSSPQEFNRVLDILRANHILIENSGPVHMSLEDSFLSIINEDGN